MTRRFVARRELERQPDHTANGQWQHLTHRLKLIEVPTRIAEDASIASLPQGRLGFHCKQIVLVRIPSKRSQVCVNTKSNRR